VTKIRTTADGGCRRVRQAVRHRACDGDSTPCGNPAITLEHQARRRPGDRREKSSQKGITGMPGPPTLAAARTAAVPCVPRHHRVRHPPVIFSSSPDQEWGSCLRLALSRGGLYLTPTPPIRVRPKT